MTQKRNIDIACLAVCSLNMVDLLILNSKTEFHAVHVLA